MLALGVHKEDESNSGVVLQISQVVGFNSLGKLVFSKVFDEKMHSQTVCQPLPHIMDCLVSLNSKDC